MADIAANPEDFSLGVTKLLDELLQDEDETTTKSSTLPLHSDLEALPEPDTKRQEMMKQTLQRTKDLVGTLKLYSKSLDCNDLFDIDNEDLDFNSTAASDFAADSLVEAICANEVRLQRMRSEILGELRRRSDARDEAERDISEDQLNLDDLLAECDAISEVTKGWIGHRGGPPPGWRKVEDAPTELPENM
mmetsp:Transcript_35227/g.75020  ORF Transcript_35227/g.75020 Transcript_35227/m.75020 type:complete len:191 (-) Transcript_35227:307-879(-)|eukprot:CAMPEP_0206469504 /NCGR_PEP_ID=MMETSP0324_2-20121206/30324_1 /ASSEMBLY_ACC=CAM_ASM_000836 /TAXON_ID=2866 /ORGANISM="Crypthecodinium cohnii, Strain Seligo" /LENGTH=190 /DNA_ID=CAMNT_0053943285 /DNA_START=186 /DNA_END=758 /DNA_ORIENTATION=-